MAKNYRGTNKNGPRSVGVPRLNESTGGPIQSGDVGKIIGTYDFNMSTTEALFDVFRSYLTKTTPDDFHKKLSKETPVYIESNEQIDVHVSVRNKKLTLYCTTTPKDEQCEKNLKRRMQETIESITRRSTEIYSC